MADKAKKRPEFDPALWASYAPESMRVPLGTALGALKEFWPAEPLPESMQMVPGINMGMPAVAGTTRFITGGVPNKALRALHTERYLDDAEALGMNNADRARALENALSNPRTVAHMRLGEQTAANKSSAESIGETLLGKDAEIRIPGVDPGRPGKIPVLVNPRPPKSPLAHNAQTAGESVIHETFHVGQALGNKDLANLYNLAEQSVGYGPNPYEVTARLGTAARTGHSAASPVNATKLMEGISLNAPRALAKGDVQGAVSREMIGEILSDRAAGIPRNDEAIRQRAIDSLSALLQRVGSTK